MSRIRIDGLDQTTGDARYLKLTGGTLTGLLNVYSGAIDLGANVDQIISSQSSGFLELRAYQGGQFTFGSGTPIGRFKSNGSIIWQTSDSVGLSLIRFSAGTASDFLQFIAENSATILARITAAGNLTVASRVNLASRVTPTGNADPQGAVGDIVIDDSFMYMKTTVGWKRSALFLTF